MLNARTTSSPIEVEMHKTYEGSFLLRNDLVSPLLIDCLSCDLDDPEPWQDRRRNLVQKRSGKTMIGRVFWGEDRVGNQGKKRGEVVLETKNNLISLIV